MSPKLITPCINHPQRPASNFHYDASGKTKSGHLCSECWGDVVIGYLFPYDDLVQRKRLPL